MPGRGKPSQREGQRAENAKGGTEGLRKGALESRGGVPWGPGRIRRCQEILE